MLAPSNTVDVIEKIANLWTYPENLTADDVKSTFVQVKLNGLQNSR